MKFVPICNLYVSLMANSLEIMPITGPQARVKQLCMSLLSLRYPIIKNNGFLYISIKLHAGKKPASHFITLVKLSEVLLTGALGNNCFDNFVEIPGKRPHWSLILTKFKLSSQSASLL